MIWRDHAVAQGLGGMRRQVNESRAELALEGKMEEHHRFLLKVQLHRLQAAEEDLAILGQRLQEKLAPYATQLASRSTGKR